MADNPAFEGNLTKVKLLLQQDASILDRKDEDGRTLLHWAVSGGHLNLVKYLLDQGALVDIPDETGWTPLLISVSTGNWDIFEHLLNQPGININVQTEDLMGCLHYAVSKNRREISKRLLEAGVDPDLRDKRGATPLHRACSLGHLDLINLLVTDYHAKIDVSDQFGNTPLHLAAEGNHGLAVRRLLELGADKERRNKDKEFPMDLTTEKGIKKMLQVDA